MLNFTKAQNGLILLHEGETFVFTSPQQLTEWMVEHFPYEGPKTEITLLAVPKDRLISCIKVVREYTGKGLREAKDFVDLVRNGDPQAIHGLSQNEALNLVRALRDIGVEYRY